MMDNDGWQNGNVSDLLTHQDKATVNELAYFLVKIEDDRKSHRKEVQEKAQAETAAEDAPMS